MAERKIKFSDTCNSRHIGGYLKKDGTKTKDFKFIRSDAPIGLTDEDKKMLKELNITTVIDLRGTEEVKVQKHAFEGCEGIEYFNVSVMKGSSVAPHAKSIKDFDMGDLYVFLVKESKEEFKEVFQIIKNAKGNIFFNCAIGKDRTGVLSALLLMLAEVSERDVIANYTSSEENLKPKMDALIKRNLKVHEEYTKNDESIKYLQSEARYIKKAIDYINNEEHGILNYFKNLGFNEKEIQEIKDKV